jgi:hypothetical protein
LAGLATVGLATTATLLVGAPAALSEPADPTPPATEGEQAGPPIGPATPGTEICRVSNANLDEITGMVAVGDVIYAVEGGTTVQPPAVTIWTINATTCEATSQSYGLSPIDPQDLALGTDGALWVADTGLGLSGDRSWVTLERVDLSSGATAVAYRALYPPSGSFNGTAMVLDDTNQPIIIGNVGQTALLFRPTGPLPANTQQNLPTLQQVGQFTPVSTGTSTPRGAFGRLFVSGAAISPDRTKVVIRTESDAYEFTITGGDIVASITEGTPTITPLPDEENGQAITYSSDGSRFLTLSGGENPVLRAYTPYVPPPPAPEGGSSGEGGGGSRLSFDDITTIATITGFLGLVAVVVGVVGIVRARRQYFAESPEARTRTRGPREPRGDRRDRRDSERWDSDEDDSDEYGATRPAWPPRSRDRDSEWSEDAAHPGRAPAHVGMDDEYGVGPEPRHGGSTYGAGGGRVYGSGGTTYGSSGHGSSAGTYGSDHGGTTYEAPGPGGTTYGPGGTTYGSGGTTYGSSGRGSGGTTYGSGGTYRSGGTTYGSSGHEPHGHGSRGTTYGSGRSGGVYGRPRSERDDDEPRRPYGHDNVDL